jgi:hypothetical protein
MGDEERDGIVINGEDGRLVISCCGRLRRHFDRSCSFQASGVRSWFRMHA